MDQAFFVKLPNRGIIRVSGHDRIDFLQNLITNDMSLLKNLPSLYACFLSPQGKFLHDFFITAENDSYLLECEGGTRAEDLLKKIKPYKIGMKVELSCKTDTPVFSVSVEKGFPDPRHNSLGFRSFEKPENLPEKSFAAWDERRIRLGIPDGSRDIAISTDTPLDCNIDKFHGISFDKGCYIGQEITARMHMRGLVKKHLIPVEICGPPIAPFTDIHINGKLAGQMRSSCGNIGLAMIKDEALPLPETGPIRLLVSL